MDEIKITSKVLLAVILPLGVLLFLVGWFLGRGGWTVAELGAGPVKLVPPTSSLNNDSSVAIVTRLVEVTREVQRPVEVTRLVEVTPIAAIAASTSKPNSSTTVPTPTIPPPTPDSRLFWDDFESGIKPEWNMRGDYGVVNGDFVVNGQYFEGYIGDKSWTDYEVSLDLAGATAWEGNVFYLPVRIQDKDNYMLFDWFYSNGCFFQWHKVVQGKDTVIPSSGVKLQGCCQPCTNYNVRIEIRGDTYRVFVNGQQLLSFVDTTFKMGGVGFRSSGGAGITLRDFEIRSLKQ